MRRPILHLLIAFAGLAVAGCAAGGKSASPPAEKTSSWDSASPVKPAQAEALRRDLMNFADRFTSSTVAAYDGLADKAPPGAAAAAVRGLAIERKLNGVTSAYANATEPSVTVGLLDMLVMVRLLRAGSEDAWFSERFGAANASKLVTTLRAQEDDLWRLALRYVTAEQLTELSDVIETWRREHPSERYVSMVRVADFPQAQAAVAAKSSKSIFGLLFLDPLAGLDPTMREVERSRELAERAFFYVQRMPILVSWRIEALSEQTLRGPELEQLMKNAAEFAGFATRFNANAEAVTKLVAQVPQQLREERQQTVDHVARRTQEERTAAVRQVADAVATERTVILKETERLISTQRDATVKQVSQAVAAERGVVVGELNTSLEAHREAFVHDMEAATSRVVTRLFIYASVAVSLGVLLATLAFLAVRRYARRATLRKPAHGTPMLDRRAIHPTRAFDGRAMPPAKTKGGASNGGLGMAMGLVALLVLCGCGSAPLDYRRTASFAFHSPQETELGRAVESRAAAHPGESGIFLLPTGPEAMAARLALAEVAQRSLDLQYFMWEDDLVGNVLLGSVLAAGDRGVRVRLLLDDYFQIGRDKKWAAVDGHPNIEVRMFNPAGGVRSSKLSRAVQYAFGPKRIQGRMHNKAMVADGAAVIVGGRNMADEYFAAHEEYNFADQDVLAVGPAARAASDTFDQYWNSPLAVPITAFAKAGSPTLDEVRAAAAERRAGAKDSAYADRLRNSELIEQMKQCAVPWTWARVDVLADDPGKMLLKIEDEPAAFMKTRLAAAMDSAGHEVLMVSPYFVAGKWGLEWVRREADRGVTVRLITNSLASNDVAAAHGGYARCRKDLLRSGVEVYELRADPERSGAERALYGNEARNALHAKMLILDRESLFIGSFNLDQRSAKLDSQNGMLIHNPELAGRMAARFEAGTSPRYTYRVTMDGQRLTWTCEKGGRPWEYSGEPETTGMRRFKASFFGTVAPKKWL